MNYELRIGSKQLVVALSLLKEKFLNFRFYRLSPFHPYLYITWLTTLTFMVDNERIIKYT